MREQGWWGLANIGQFIGLDVQTYGPTERVQQAAQAANFEADHLKPAGARIKDKEVWPTVLDKDFEGDEWRKEFRNDFPELPVEKYKSVEELRAAYVDYWWEKKGDVKNVGESQRRDDLRRAFNSHRSIDLWDKNEQLEMLRFWRAYPDLLREATRLGLNQYNDEEREIAGVQ